jgi:hypothetical protein
MNPLAATLATLNPDARQLLEATLPGARQNFERDHRLYPCAFAVTLGMEPEVYAIEEMNDQTKPALWAFMARLRRTRPVAAFLSEVWMAKCKPGDVNPDGSLKIMPRDHPDKTEWVLFSLWSGKRTVMVRAEIKRQPDLLGPWEVMWDSDYPDPGFLGKKADSVGGEMMEGQRWQGEDN